MKELIKSLNQKPIAYYPIYRLITGSTTAAILLSQLMYWFTKKDKIYKTNEELIQETLLTKQELKTAKKIIKKLPFVKVELEGIPARTYYSIDWDKYIETINNFCENNLQNDKDVNFEPTSWCKSHQLDGVNHTNSVVQIAPTITENTTENTTDIKKENNKKKKVDTVGEDAWFKDKNFSEAWDEWQDVRKSKKASKTERAYKRALNKLKDLSGNDKEKAIKILLQSADNGWTDLYPLKENSQNDNNYKSKKTKLPNLDYLRIPEHEKPDENDFKNLKNILKACKTHINTL